jgi:hypothetical protein
MTLLLNSQVISQINIDKYLWFYPQQKNLVINSNLQLKLQIEIQKIIDRGDLLFRPQTCRYNDQYNESYFIYQEPGRILRTLAMAYPYLTTAQQNEIKLMIPGLYSNPVHAPWSEAPLSADQGNPREFYQADVLWGLNSPFGSYRPSIHGIYSLWLWLYRSGDTTSVQPYYEDIRNFYDNKTGNSVDPGNLYGTMCAHIGMARLAGIFNDTATISNARDNLNLQLQRGLDIHYADSMAFFGTQGWNAPYGPEYHPRKDQLIYRGFIFLGMSPEIGRYLRDTLFTPVIQRHLSGLQSFPNWWLLNSQYYTRWAGDESIGIPSEMFGMVSPVERWVRLQEPQVMWEWMRSSPAGNADCYWLEALVDALESASETEWIDVRTQPYQTDFIHAVAEILQAPVPPMPGNDSCYGALDYLSVAGNGKTFIVQNGTNSILKAGKTIELKPGTQVMVGGFLNASITSPENICPPDVLMAPGISNPAHISQPLNGQRNILPDIGIYPNPASKSTTLKISNLLPESPFDIYIYNIHGVAVYHIQQVNENTIALDLHQFPKGIYLIRANFSVKTGHQAEMATFYNISKRLIIQR